MAGGKIRNVVCANERLASEILKAKVLRERVTFMPLNRIQFRKVDRKIVDEISKLTDGSAKLALDLIDYEPKYEAVMQQVFGSIFICDDQDSAKKICYNSKFSFTCVTLQGDKYEASGGLHGGSAPQGVNRLAQIDNYMKGDKNRREKEKTIFQEKQSLDRL